MSIMAKTPSGYKKIGSAYLGERPVDKVFNANGDVIYALQRELTGVPPLLFKGKEQSELLNYRIYGNTETKQRDYSGSSPLTVPVYDGELYNYRIYGNTVNGDSVGDRTGNLFDMNTWANTITNVRGNGIMSISGNTVSITSVDMQDCYTVPYMYSAEGVYKILVKPNTNYRIQYSKSSNASVIILENGTTSYMYTSTGPITTHSDTTFLTLRMGVSASAPLGTTATISEFIISEGSEPHPYEPYGYKVPITVTNSGTTSNETIYLPEPIKMVGSEAEYVDFYTQKQYFADGTNTSVTIPALPISTGTNTVTVNTTVQPSSVEVSVDENVSVGDLVTSGQHTGEYKVPVTVEGKNSLQNTATSQTINGVTFTVNTDGSVTCNTDENGATATTRFYLVGSSGTDFKKLNINANAIITGCPHGGNVNTYALFILRKNDDMDPSYYNTLAETGSGLNLVYNETNKYVIFINISTGTICDNLTFYPMLRKADIEDDTYEPYHAPVTTPIYLPEPIKMVGDEAEYIDYGEQKQHRVRKNLFDENTITEGAYIDKFTGNIVTGSTTSNVSDFISVVPNNTYTLSYAYIKLSSSNRRVIGFYSALKEWVSFIEYSPLVNTGFNINVPNDIYYIKVTTDIKMTNVMLNSGSEPLAYEPYIENVDIDVTLPALPTVTGTNVLSVGTEVQPSRMDIKGRIKSLT